jgi:hypothetical protein
VNETPAQALARTVQLIANDVFGCQLGEDPDLEKAIVEGLRSATIRLAADQANLESYTGQTALATLFGLLAMMGLGIDLDIPEVELLPPQPPLVGHELRSALLAYGNDLIPQARVGTSLGEPELTCVLGDTISTDHKALRLTGDAWRCHVAREESAALRRWQGRWPIGALEAAAAAAPEGLRAALPRIAALAGRPLPPDARFHLELHRGIDLDLSVPGLRAQPLILGDVDFVSGGAITTAALYVLARVPGLSGRLRVIEPERLDLGNLNRYGLARRSDCDMMKIDVLARISSGKLSVVGLADRFDQDAADRIGLLAPRVMVGVDDIPSRWTVQREAPDWVCVAGTTHFYGLVTTHRRGEPCAGCAHPRDDDFTGPIPTISFVSFWAGLMQARALLVEASSARDTAAALHVWPFGLYGPRAVHPTGLMPRPDCPVGCAASRTAA